MQTRLIESVQHSLAGKTAETILRSCVHCGFCTATCPTYRVQGDELDGPRGRIYLIKQMLEGQRTGAATRSHLDRCLTCQSCETTCPSGVEYGRLLDIGRNYMEDRIRRPLAQTAMRKSLRMIVPYPNRFRFFLGLARMVQPLLPEHWRINMEQQRNPESQPPMQHPRTMLILEGCVQSVITPDTNAATARLLDKLGISLVHAPAAGCCGGISRHLAAPEEALGFIRRNIDAWWPHVEAGVEAIIITASGCGAVIKEYGYYLKDDPAYAEKALRISAMAQDLVEVLEQEELREIRPAGIRTVAFHSPCTLQHGLKLNGRVESLLRKIGFTLTRVRDSHICCGSAGTYSLLQPGLSRRLLNDKVKTLEAERPDIIATANIGCQIHLGRASKVQVVHWAELLDAQISRKLAND